MVLENIDQVKFAICAIFGIVGLSLVAIYIAPAVFNDFGQLVVGIAIGAIAGLAGNQVSK